jgi:hypothetical protein
MPPFLSGRKPIKSVKSLSKLALARDQHVYIHRTEFIIHDHSRHSLFWLERIVGGIMPSSKQKFPWLWIISGCGLLAFFACIFVAVIGAGGFLFANQTMKANPSTEQQLSGDIIPQTALLQNPQGWVEVGSDIGPWSPAAPNQMVAAGQHVRTGQLSSADLVFNDGSRVSLQADSEIAIDQLVAEKDGQPRTIVLTQVSGESTHQVVPDDRSDSRYEVITPSGAGLAKGTEFHVIVTPEHTAYYYVLHGVVAVSGMQTTVLVNPGFMTVIYLSQPPLPPVQSISVEGLVSQTGSQWTIAGTTFIVNEKTVILGSPQIGDWVVAKGHVDENKQDIADWIILLHHALTDRFSLTGAVEAIGDTEWTIDGQTIEITQTTDIDEGIQVNDTVHVEGSIETGGSLLAHKIELVDAEEGLPFKFTGIVQKIDGALWTISGVSVATNEKTSFTEGLKTGDRVEVRGWIQKDGVWLAKSITRVDDDQHEFAFTGKLESMDPWKVAGIAFETREYTVIQPDLKIGDLVRVEGEIDADGLWIASKIERIELGSQASMVVIGTVISIDPWIVNGISINVSDETVISGNIQVGMLVRVELVLQPDGTWLALKIEPLNALVWFPSCIDVIATVVSIDGHQLQLLDWPLMTLEDGVPIEGTLAPDSIIRLRICFDQAMAIHIAYIVILVPGETLPPVGDLNGKVLVCHKPDGKKGGHTLSIGRPALPAHLGHGDYVGPCK